MDRITLSPGSDANAGILQHFNDDADYNKNPDNNANYPGHIGYSGSNSPDDHHLNGTDSYNSDDVRGQLVEFTWHTTIRRHVEFLHEC